MATFPRSPFMEVPVACPRCGQTQPQRLFQEGVFTAGDRESDQHVLRYVWADPAMETPHPPFHAVLFCPVCHYADLAEDYLDPQRGAAIPAVVAVAADLGATRHGVLDALGRHIRYPDVDFESALNLHLLAVFFQTLPPPDQQDTTKIGRMLLRTAWLYRERDPRNEAHEDLPTVRAMGEAAQDLEAALLKARGRWDEVQTLMARRGRELAPRLARPDADPYMNRRLALNLALDQVWAELFQVRRTMRRDLAGDLLKDDPSPPRPFFNYPSYAAFFGRVKAAWPFAPADEIEAMRGAIQYFHRALSADCQFEDPSRHIAMVRLMADLMARCGDLDEALALTRSIIQNGLETRSRSMKQLQEYGLEEPDRRRIKARLETAALSMRQAGELRRRLLGQVRARDLPRVQEVLQKMGAAPPEAIVQALREAGMSEDLIDALKEEGQPLDFLVRRKGGPLR